MHLKRGFGGAAPWIFLGLQMANALISLEKIAMYQGEISAFATWKAEGKRLLGGRSTVLEPYQAYGPRLS